MKKLGERNYLLLKLSLKSSGSYAPEDFRYEEELYIDEAEHVLGFLAWVNENPQERCFGSGNYEERYAEFKNRRCVICEDNDHPANVSDSKCSDYCREVASRNPEID